MRREKAETPLLHSAKQLYLRQKVPSDQTLLPFMSHLLSPGPVPIPASIQAALSRPVIHHRSPAFRQFYLDLLGALRYLFQTQHQVGTLIGSGTYGVEAAMYSLFRPGEAVLVLSMGKFSQRWADYAPLLRLETHTLAAAWGESLSSAAVLSAAAGIPNLRGVVITHSETSTGAGLDLESIALALREAHPELLLLVDGITSVGAIPYYHDAWALDASLVASQKSLMNPAGLVAFALSPRAEAALRPTHPGDFCNLYNYVQAATTGDYPFTPPVQLLYGVAEALRQLRDETLPVRWNRTHQTAQHFRTGLKALGGAVFPSQPVDSLTAFTWPGQDLSTLKMRLEAAGYILAGGQGPLKGQILRISHFAHTTPELMEAVLQTLRHAHSEPKS